MQSSRISYQNTNKFSKLIIDYLKNEEKLQPFFNHYPTLENFSKQIEEKRNHLINRDLLVSTLYHQNQKISLSKETKNNIDALLDKNTFTITTGHQPCLFTGPLYFIYKIVSTINLCKSLSKKYSDTRFVPVFWLASEDHDFEEISEARVFKQTIKWERSLNGPVGRMKLDGLDLVLKNLKDILGEKKENKEIVDMLEGAYLTGNNLSEATRQLVNKLFREYGLVIIDGDDKGLKNQILPIIKKDVLKKDFFQVLTDCTQELSLNYKQQAFIRPINFFHLSDGSRQHINQNFSEKEIENNVDAFSPNVLMRPLYQESVLPNLAYLGGSSEIAYFMQLKMTFDRENIPFPMLVLRNSVLCMNQRQCNQLKRFNLTAQDLFLSNHELHQKFIQFASPEKIHLEKEEKKLKDIFSCISDKIEDKSTKLSISLELRKMEKSFQKLKKRLMKFEKRKHQENLKSIDNLKNNLFPKNHLQERIDNFIPYYIEHGNDFIKILIEHLDPLDTNFVILHP